MFQAAAGNYVAQFRGGQAGAAPAIAGAVDVDHQRGHGHDQLEHQPGGDHPDRLGHGQWHARAEARDRRGDASSIAVELPQFEPGSHVPLPRCRSRDASSETWPSSRRWAARRRPSPCRRGRRGNPGCRGRRRSRFAGRHRLRAHGARAAVADASVRATAASARAGGNDEPVGSGRRHRASRSTSAHLAPGQQLLLPRDRRTPHGGRAQSHGDFGSTDAPRWGVADSRLAQWRDGRSPPALAVDRSAVTASFAWRPAQSSGTYVSRVLDVAADGGLEAGSAGTPISPSGTRLAVQVRTGSTSTPGPHVDTMDHDPRATALPCRPAWRTRATCSTGWL